MTHQTNAVRLAIGDVIEIDEADYCYGTGTLRLRLTVPVDVRRYPAMEWTRVRGIELHRDGTDGEMRDAVVRVAALVRAAHARRASPPGT